MNKMAMKTVLTRANLRVKWSLLAVVAYILLFLATRLINITSFPLYIDEITHIFVAKLTVNGNFFIGLSETAKQLYIWLVAVSFQFFDDPIFAARIVSVLSGLVSAGICYKLTDMFYPARKIAYLAALFYLISPFAVLFDRMALADSLLATLIGSSILVSLQLWRSPSVKWALVLGVLFGLAVLNKAYAVIYYPTPILLWLFLGRTINWSKIAKLLAITYATASIAWLLIFFIGRLAYQDYLQKKSVTGSVETEFLTRFGNYSLLIAEWLSSYLTLPLVGLLVFTAVRMIIKLDKPGFVLILLVSGPLLAFALTFTDLYSRYLFPVIVPLSVMIVWGIDELAKFFRSPIEKIRSKIGFPSSISHLAIRGTILLVFCLPSLSFSYLIITEPARAPFPSRDKDDYIVGAQAARGYKEIAQFMEDLTQRHQNLIFLRHALPSPLEVILGVYLPDRVVERIDFVEVRDFDQITPQSLNRYASQVPTLTVESELITASNSNLKLLTYSQLWPVASFAGPNRKSKVGVYQWLLPPDFAIRWFQQGGDKEPRIAWQPADTLVTATDGILADWPQPPNTTAEAIWQALVATNIEYVLATPALIRHQPDLFAPFITTDGATLTLKQMPPGWRLAFAYPDLNCQWCLFQLRPPDHPTQITFGEAIVLEGYDISMTQLSADESLHITLYWQSLASLPESYIVFVHLLDTHGQLVNQVDELPLQGNWPTNYWQAGGRLADRHTLHLDSALPAGDYTISVGLYNPADLVRLPAQSRQNLVMDNAIALTTVSLGYHRPPGGE